MAATLRREDVEFLLLDWLDCHRLSQAGDEPEIGRDLIVRVLDAAEKLAVDAFLPHYKKSDADEPRLGADGVEVLPDVASAIRQFAAAGFFSTRFPVEHGGQGLPETIHTAVMAYFMAANVATASYAMLTVGNANLITRFGTGMQIRHFAMPQINGDALGTMCLSETQAGSGLLDIRTRAVPDGEDRLGHRYRLFGSKMWISGGDQDITHNIVHLVLARSQDASGAGTRALSLFAVPKFLPGTGGGIGERNDVAAAGLNHKMGQRGISNCVMAFGEGTRWRPQGAVGAIGYRIGDAGEGLPIMFHMMNEARIAVGLGAAVLAARGAELSVRYANERRQGRSAGSAEPVPIVMHPDVRRMLLTQRAYVDGCLGLVFLSSRLVDGPIRSLSEEEVKSLVELLTPIAKSWTSEFGCAANDIAIQIHGGYGYTRDFDVEQLYRDNRLNAIHEGTTGIQALDLLGRKIVKDRGRTFGILQTLVDDTIARAALRSDLAKLATRLDACSNAVVSTVQSLLEGSANIDIMPVATPFLRAMGHYVVGWILLDQCLCATGAGHSDADRRTVTTRHFFAAELPRVECWLGECDPAADLAGAAPVSLFQWEGRA